MRVALVGQECRYRLTGCNLSNPGPGTIADSLTTPTGIHPLRAPMAHRHHISLAGLCIARILLVQEDIVEIIGWPRHSGHLGSLAINWCCFRIHSMAPAANPCAAGPITLPRTTTYQ